MHTKIHRYKQWVEGDGVDWVDEVVDAVAFKGVILLLYFRARINPLDGTPALNRRLHKSWTASK